MKIPNLQPRLQELKALIPEGACLADVGTDHGYIPALLLREGKIKGAIASDIAAAPLAHARKTAELCGVAKQMELRLSDGLAAYAPGEADCYLIAGMGGETILSILEKAPWLKRENALLILQPQTKQELLRSWIATNGYIILKERLVLDRTMLYTVLIVQPGESPPLSAEELHIGVGLDADPLYRLHLKRLIDRTEKILEGLRLSAGHENDAQREQAERLLFALTKRMKEDEV